MRRFAAEVDLVLRLLAKWPKKLPILGFDVSSWALDKWWELLLLREAERVQARPPGSHLRRLAERVQPRPPGSRLRRLAERVVSPSTYTFVLEPTLSDLAEEHAHALAEDRPWKAWRVRLRGYGSFWAAVTAHLVAVLGRRVARFWARS